MTSTATGPEEPILHIGYPKCGSTYLQTKIWPHVKGTEFLAEDGEEEALLTSRNFWELPDDLSFFKRGRSAYCYSNEAILTHRHAIPGDDQKLYFDRCLDNLLRIFADYGHFLIQIRRQDQLALSVYQYSSPSFLTSPEKIFIDFPRNYLGSGVIKLSDNLGQIYLDSFDFWRLVSRLMTFIGRDRITVLPLEELQQNPDRYFEKLSAVFKEDLSGFQDTHQERVNVSDAARHRYPAILRGLAPLVKKTGLANSARRLFARKAGLSDQFSQDVLKYFEQGNRKLSETFNLDLERYDYF